MDFGWLDLLKGASPVTIIVVAAATIVFLRISRAAIRKDNREDLGLGPDEKLSDKIDGAVVRGFADSVHPLTAAIAALSKDTATLGVEVKGQRTALDTHRDKITILELQVAALTGQVGGMPAVHALRSRIERKRAAAPVARKEAEGPEEGT